MAVQEALYLPRVGSRGHAPTEPAQLGWIAQASLVCSPTPRCSGLWTPSGPLPGGRWGSFLGVEPEGGLAAQQGLRVGPFSLQALAISDHFPVEVTLKSY